MKKIAANSVMALLAQCVALISGFVLPRLLLEHFGSEVNGLTQSLKQFLGVINFLDLGVGQVMRSALYRPLAKGDNNQISCIMISGKRFYRQLACILLGYVLILTCVYPMIAEQEFGWFYIASLIIAMGISSFAQYYFGIANEQLLQADQRGYVVFTLQIIANILNVILSVWMIRAGASIQSVKLVASFVFLIRPVVVWLYVRRHYRLDRNIRFEGEPIAQKKDGVAQHISAVVLDGTDTIVLTMMSTFTNVSIYSVYYMIIGSIQGFYQAATAGIQSAAGMLWAKKNHCEMKHMSEQVEMLLHAVIVFVFSCMGVLIVPFVQVYTKGLTDANYIQPVFAVVLVLAYGIRCLRTPYNIWILAAGHFKQTRICHIMAAVINLIVSILAVSNWGLVGVAVGTLVAMLYQTSWMALYCAKKLIIRPVHTVLKRFMVDAFIAGLVFFLSGNISLQNLTYGSWVSMALKVMLIAAGVVVAVVGLSYREASMEISRSLATRLKARIDRKPE